MQFKSFGFSDVGRVRDHNEDSYLCNYKEKLFFVADGMGGQASGEIASRLAIATIEQFVLRSRSNEVELPMNIREDLSLEQKRLMAAATFGNRKIQKTAMQDPSMKGMGTTLIGATIEDHNLVIINIGDSRLYRIREHEINQITEDHSLVGEQERNGIITREEAKLHPQKHILTNALGHMDNDSRIDTFLAPIQPGDLYLICSDGLHNMLDDDEILVIIESINDVSLYKMGLSLVLKANLAGGLDNITVVLIAF